MTYRASITEALALIFKGIDKLKKRFPEKSFTIDGRLVGDIGEVIAVLKYKIKLYDKQTPVHDGETLDGRKVQVKATFKDKLTMTAVPELYLGLKLSRKGAHRVVYNGPGSLIAKTFAHRSGLGEKQLAFSVSALQVLSKKVPIDRRVPLRTKRR